MSTIQNYKSYKKYEPDYDRWKFERDTQEAKRQQYLKTHPEKIKQEDIQRGENLIRAINVMDEFSQKRAEDMEAATETAVAEAIEVSMIFNGILFAFISKIKPIEKFLLKKLQKVKFNNSYLKDPLMSLRLIAGGVGAAVGLISALPMYAWAAKAEVGASRRGRFEAMRTELNNPNTFATFTPEQLEEIKEKAKEIEIPKKQKKIIGFEEIGSLIHLAKENKIYKKQKEQFEKELEEHAKHINDTMTPEEILQAKKDQQLLTKLIEKIDIESQNYAENAELVSTTAITLLLTIAGFVNHLCNKIPSGGNIAKIGNAVGTFILAIFASSIQKEASRVGRFKIKQEILKSPENLVYVADDDIKNIDNIKVTQTKKTNIFKFMKEALKNKKEYDEYKKTASIDDEKFVKAMQKIKLTPEQLKDAKTLQRNTFKTFNRVDEKSQQYAESIEAIGNTVTNAISWIVSGTAGVFGIKILTTETKKEKELHAKLKNRTNLNKVELKKIQRALALETSLKSSKYLGLIFASLVPTILTNAVITTKQKRASKVADMLAIKEMSDYREFR